MHISVELPRLGLHHASHSFAKSQRDGVGVGTSLQKISNRAPVALRHTERLEKEIRVPVEPRAQLVRSASPSPERSGPIYETPLPFERARLGGNASSYVPADRAQLHDRPVVDQREGSRELAKTRGGLIGKLQRSQNFEVQALRSFFGIRNKSHAAAEPKSYVPANGTLLHDAPATRREQPLREVPTPGQDRETRHATLVYERTARDFTTTHGGMIGKTQRAQHAQLEAMRELFGFRPPSAMRVVIEKNTPLTVEHASNSLLGASRQLTPLLEARHTSSNMQQLWNGMRQLTIGMQVFEKLATEDARAGRLPEGTARDIRELATNAKVANGQTLVQLYDQARRGDDILADPQVRQQLRDFLGVAMSVTEQYAALTGTTSTRL